MEFSVLTKMQLYNEQPNKEKQIWFKISSDWLSSIWWPPRRPLRGVQGTNLIALEIQNQQVWTSPGFLGKQSCGEQMSPPVWPALKAHDWGLNQQDMKGCSEMMPWCCCQEELWAPPSVAIHPPQGAWQPWPFCRAQLLVARGPFCPRSTFWLYLISLLHTSRKSQHSSPARE